MRVFLDANILFSAAKSNGAIRRLVELLLSGGHVVVVNDFVIVEARRNLERKAAEALTGLDDLLRRCEIAAVPVRLASEMSSWLPDKDRPVLESAIATRCEALVTGDRAHFAIGYGRKYGGVTVYSASGLAERILSVHHSRAFAANGLVDRIGG